ncbi:unnamed protein product [Adineta ricciae]|uniref:Uncharacterized protein n=1 Tax=Adineta ricciae TaxID=249248 RepID=A0A813YMJ9_ADIRI|nr:unnamed protein product [Adineta ricciae]CAF1288050.1 unnamed protein product [Adineta ricciae]
MGTAESSQSPELGGLGGFNAPSSFRRQSPNVARLIHGENSQKMEYEFPISDVNTSNLGHYRHHHNSGGGTSNHTIIAGNKNSHLSHPQINHNDKFLSDSKISANETSSLWSSLTNCFACRTRDGTPSTMNPLRDKVHAIRIVRASNDLTPAVFDSQYNIITLEQLRECDNNASGNLHDSSDSNSPDNIRSSHSGNGSVPSSSSKTGSNRRMKKKKKKRSTSGTYAVKAIASDDDDGYERT